jgi:hypothetical protein
MKQQNSCSILDHTDDYRELEPDFSKENLLSYHDKHRTANMIDGANISCVAIVSIKNLISNSSANVVRFDRFSHVNAESLCLKCSFCIQRNMTIDQLL